MFGECCGPGEWKRRECYDRHRQEAQANKQMLRGCFRCARRKSQSQCSNYGGLKFSRLEHAAVSLAASQQHFAASHTTSSLGRHILPLI